MGFQVCLDGNQGWIQIEISNWDEETASTSADCKEYPSPISIHVAKSGRLCFRTQSVLLKLYDNFKGYYPDHKSYRNLKIRDRDENTISSIDVGLQWAKKSTGRKNHGEHLQFKFVAISAICFPPHGTISHLDCYISGTDASITEEVKTYLNSIECYERFYLNPGSGKDLHVMLIESNGDTARRIGVANLRLEDWLKSDPKMEDIVLE